MKALDPRRVQAVFLEAVQAATHAERAAIVDRECAFDRVLRRRVLALLRSHELPNNALDTPVLAQHDTDPLRVNRIGYTEQPEVGPGTLIGERYRLLTRLGQGGMGAVYRAEQIAPIHRVVAVKLIRQGFDSRSMLQRFAAERQALALMDHPNIARVYDAGQSPPIAADDQSSRPFFVMELVEGDPITKFCTREKLTIRQRLELFLPVCHAIEHAHQKGIIHRDLKPGNVLVTRRDGKPVPVIIDFGIAKSIAGQNGDLTNGTSGGLFLGSAEYMAPEQAEPGSVNIDTRTDIYALGAMLYELLSGSVIFDRERLRRASLFDLAEILHHEEPPAPSVRAAKSAEAAPARAVSQLRGDLDWVILKCLDKDRERRYPSARALADDITRFINREPVSAGPPTATYRIRKFLRRHIGAVVGSTIVLFALISGIAGTTWGMVQARRAEASAIADRDDKERERTRADNEAAIARSVVQFLQNDLLRQADTQVQAQGRFDPDPNLTVRAALDRSAASVERRFQDQPAVEAAIRRTIGSAYDGLGEFGKAINHLTRSVTLFEQLHGPDNETVIDARYDLGNALRHASRHEEAIPLFERVYNWRLTKYGPDHRKTLATQTTMGISYNKAGHSDEAYKIFTDVYERVQRTDAGPVASMAALHNLSCLDANRGQLAETIQRMETLKDQWAATQGTDVPLQFELLLNLGQMYIRAERPGDAVRTLDEARASAQKKFSPEHPGLITSCFFLAEAHVRNGHAADAGRVLEDCRSRCLDKVGPHHSRFHAITIELAGWAAETGQLDRAETLAESTLEALEKGRSSSVTKTLAQAMLARIHYLQGHHTEAEPLIREAMSVLSVRKLDEWSYADARTLLGLTIAAQGRFAEAEPHLRNGYAGLQRLQSQLPYGVQRRMPDAIDALIRCAEALHRPEDAAIWRAERQKTRSGKS